MRRSWSSTRSNGRPQPETAWDQFITRELWLTATYVLMPASVVPLPSPPGNYTRPSPTKTVQPHNRPTRTGSALLMTSTVQPRFPK